jgi:hypothetical protein
MSDWHQKVDQHAAELARLTIRAANASEPLPEDEVAELGMLIASERQCLIDAMGALFCEEEPEAAASPGVAEFDAGFRYGLEFARALEEARMVLQRAQRGRLLTIAPQKGRAGDDEG